METVVSFRRFKRFIKAGIDIDIEFVLTDKVQRLSIVCQNRFQIRLIEFPISDKKAIKDIHEIDSFAACERRYSDTLSGESFHEFQDIGNQTVKHRNR